jgi:hypothetical protein
MRQHFNRSPRPNEQTYAMKTETKDNKEIWDEIWRQFRELEAVKDIERLQDENTSLREQLRGAQQDARRYQYLRSHPQFNRGKGLLQWYLPWFLPRISDQSDPGKRLDDSIDETMAIRPTPPAEK